MAALTATAQMGGPMTPKQIIEQMRAALRPGAAAAAAVEEAAVQQWLSVPAMVHAINDTREMGLETAARQIAFMTGHNVGSPLVEILRNRMPTVQHTATLTSSKLTLSESDDEKMMDLWQQSHERAARMHAVWDATAGYVELQLQAGISPGEKRLRLLALLNDSAGGAARTAASLYEVAASHNEMSFTGAVAGRAPLSTTPDGKVVIDVAAVPPEITDTDPNTARVARWKPEIP